MLPPTQQVRIGLSLLKREDDLTEGELSDNTRRFKIKEITSRKKTIGVMSYEY